MLQPGGSVALAGGPSRARLGCPVRCHFFRGVLPVFGAAGFFTGFLAAAFLGAVFSPASVFADGGFAAAFLPAAFFTAAFSAAAGLAAAFLLLGLGGVTFCFAGVEAAFRVFALDGGRLAPAAACFLRAAGSAGTASPFADRAPADPAPRQSPRARRWSRCPWCGRSG